MLQLDVFEYNIIPYISLGDLFTLRSINSNVGTIYYRELARRGNLRDVVKTDNISLFVHSILVQEQLHPRSTVETDENFKDLLVLALEHRSRKILPYLCRQCTPDIFMDAFNHCLLQKITVTSRVWFAAYIPAIMDIFMITYLLKSLETGNDEVSLSFNHNIDIMINTGTDSSGTMKLFINRLSNLDLLTPGIYRRILTRTATALDTDTPIQKHLEIMAHLTLRANGVQVISRDTILSVARSFQQKIINPIHREYFISKLPA